MRNHRSALLLLFAVLLLGGCATSSAPPGFLVGGRDEQADAHGAWIELRIWDEEMQELQGEFLAVEGDSLFVFATVDERWELVSLSLSDILGGKLRAYDPGTGQYAGWAVLGTLSTVSHGFYLVLTAPVWILGGTAIASSQSKIADYEFAQTSIHKLGAFARFPAGMPDGLDRSRLQPKPLPVR